MKCSSLHLGSCWIQHSDWLEATPPFSLRFQQVTMAPCTSWLLVLHYIDHLLLLSLLQMKTVMTIRAFYLETSHCAARWSSNYQKCCNCYKLTCSSPVQPSAHPRRPKSTAGPGLCFMQRGEEGAGAFLNVVSIQPWQTLWRNGRRTVRWAEGA